MLEELDRYPLYMVARELSDKRHLGKEYLLCLLREGKIISHVDDKQFRINIPKAYWNGINLDDFSIFSNQSQIGKDYFIKSNRIIIELYSTMINECDEFQPEIDDKSLSTIDSIGGLIENCYDDIADIEKKSSASHGTYDDEMKIDEGIEIRLPSLESNKKKSILSFARRAKNLQIYVSKDEWTAYLKIFRPKDKRIIQGGRPMSLGWFHIYAHIIRLIIKEQNKGLPELMGFSGKSLRNISLYIENWLSTTTAGEPKLKLGLDSIYRNLRDIEDSDHVTYPNRASTEPGKLINSSHSVPKNL